VDYSVEEEDSDDMEIARALVRDGWMSTSNKRRTIARLPEGKTGLEALRDVAPEAHDTIMSRAEQQAANGYRRIFASEGDGTRQTLDVSMWMAFKKAGGESSF
jgi:hypothetical protein